VAAVAGVAQSGNWLGDSFSRDIKLDRDSNSDGDKDDDRSWKDADGDGFSDSLEENMGSDPNNPALAPRAVLSTRLAARVGPEILSNEDENSGDEKADQPADVDFDRGRDSTEGKGESAERGASKGDGIDSDADGLPDAKEVAIGSNLRHPDSDGDGVSDGREFDFGADPMVPEPR
jgi:hypothetical protein